MSTELPHFRVLLFKSGNARFYQLIKIILNKSYRKHKSTIRQIIKHHKLK